MDKIRYRKEGFSSERKKNPEGLKIFNSWFFQLGFLLISGVFLFNVYKSVRITSQKLDILKQAEREVEDLRLKNLALSIEMLDMSTDQYLETEARNRLNFGGKNEIAFVIPENSIESAKTELERMFLKEDKKEDPLANVDPVVEWIEFIQNGV